MPTSDIAGHQLYFAHHRATSTHRPQLIMIHGAGGSHLDWPVELRLLSPYPVLIPDLPGHGHSQGATLASIEAYATVLEEWIKQLSLEDVVLLGHSMGGAIVLALAIRQATAISGIVIIASGARLRVSQDILRGIREQFSETTNTLLNAYWGPDAPPDAIDASRRRMQAAGSELFYDDFRVTDAFDVMDRLSEIAIPALVIAGDHDPLTPPKYARYLAQRLPNADLHVIPDTHHMLHLQQPRTVARLVRDFLDRRL